MENKLDILLGLQWGDEGKGKIVDYLSEKYDVIARYQGGANAGHTLKIGNMTHVLHLIPSGIFHKDKINIIGNGVVLDPFIFKEECEDLKSLNIDCVSRLLIAKRAHLILPSHRLLDAVYEKSKGNDKIGSTLKGIGPSYTDKIARLGIRVGDIVRNNFNEKYNALKESHLAIAKMYNFDVSSIQIDKKSFDDYEKAWFEAIDYLKKFTFVDCEQIVNKYLSDGKSILAEGAQGTMLDIDFGTYPYVTSSNTVTAGVCTGLGVAPSKIGRVFGIVKAYCTRVGAGPFPTELKNGTGDTLRIKGFEFGATTGRPRRCGWIDLVQLKYSVMINGVTDLVITKPDVMNHFDTIKACTSYFVGNNNMISNFPYDLNIDGLQPIYTDFEGWKTELLYANGYKALPLKFKEYLDFISTYLVVPISIISTGPDREETIYLR